MQNQFLISTLVSLALVSSSYAADLPAWITQGQTMDSTYHFVVCSYDGLDPEDVKQVAESKCLASAAKLGGVNVKITQKTVQSLTGADSSEVAEIQPLERNIKCEWTERFLEKVGQGYRVWLRCRVKKSSLIVPLNKTTSGSQIESSPNIPSVTTRKYQRGILMLTMVPQADRILVIGDAGERVVEVTSNVMRVELHEGDTKVLVKKQRFKEASFELKSWKHGDSMSQTLYLEQEM